MTQLYLAYLFIGILALGIGLFSKTLKRTVFAPPLVALAAGIAVGPVGADWLRPGTWPGSLEFLEEAARLTVSMGVMGAALRIPKTYLGAHWKTLSVLLGIIMPLMGLATGAAALVLPGLPVLGAFLIGAAAMPTDPVIASSIVTGDMAERNIPARVRNVLSAESGANDGLAYPLVLLPINLLTRPPGDIWGAWTWEAVLRGVGGALLIGIVSGLVFGSLIRLAEKHRYMEKPSFLSLTIALTLWSLGLGRILDADGILAVFVTGATLNRLLGMGDRSEEERVQEAINKFFTLPIFLILGTMLPWKEWEALGWRGIFIAACALFLRRPPFMILLGRWLVFRRSFKDLLFAGWFGPIGVSALFYALLARRETGDDIYWTMTSLIICVSVVVHGASAGPLTRLYGGSGHADASAAH